MSTAEDLHKIEISIEQAKASIKRQECLERLEKNQDFKEIISEGFLEKHAVRQVMLKSHPGLQDESQQKIIQNQIDAIGGLKQYLINVFTEGMNAKQALEADEKTREELLAEELA